MLRLLLVSVAGVVVCESSAVYARFDQVDADLVDQEERLENASFHDANTYRFYPRFERRWDGVDMGYRVSDGSYDANRSRIHEQIKLGTSTDELFWLAYSRDHYHDLVDRYSQDEIRIAVKPALGIYFAGLADGTSSYKQWGDLGAAVGWMAARYKYVEFYHWSVDHFYNSKNEVDRGVYHKKPATSGLRLLWDESGVIRVKSDFEVDKEFTWERFDCNCEYSYEWWRGRYQVQFKMFENYVLEANGDTANKRESKRWIESGNRDYEKKLEKKSNRHELSLLREPSPASYTQLGYIRIQRRADYEFAAINIPTGFTYFEDPSPDAAHRETIAFLMHNLAMDDGNRYFFQAGLTQNWVQINRELKDEDLVGRTPERAEEFKAEFSDEAAMQQKMQIAFELHLRENFWLFLNATLDVDGIRKEFPYKEAPTPGNIWDGGGVQLMATF